MATHQKKHIKNNNTIRELLLCSEADGEMYGQLNLAKGDARFEVRIIQNNLVIIAKARGSLIKGPRKQKLNKDDYVLLQKDQASDDKYYIIHKYTLDDTKKLKKSGQLSTINDFDNDDDDNDENQKTQILFDGDIISNKLDEIEIDDNFIAGI